MGPEASIERTIRREAISAGWKARKVKFLDINGCPDHLFGKDMRAVWIEFKRMLGEARKQQLLRHAELRMVFGFEVHVCDSLVLARHVLLLPVPVMRAKLLPHPRVTLL